MKLLVMKCIQKTHLNTRQLKKKKEKESNTMAYLRNKEQSEEGLKREEGKGGCMVRRKVAQAQSIKRQRMSSENFSLKGYPK